MANENRPPRLVAAPTTAEREQVIAFLSDRFAAGELEVAEFEERVTLAHRAQSAADLDALKANLSPSQSTLVPPSAVELVHDAPTKASTVAIFGGTRRAGNWRVPRHLRVVAVFGGVELDFRNARLPPGSIDVDVLAAFGGIQVIVPPDLAVEVHGKAIMGGFEQVDRVPATPDAHTSILRVHGRVIFGGVSIDTRLPGESPRAAHRRRRRERRALRHAR